MSSDQFGQWWPCPRKHYKRTAIWLPRAMELADALEGKRTFRYFTLCARPMIDVYMLVRAGILPLDRVTKRIEGVSFCEADETIFPEMIELVGVEEAGFPARLEDLALFRDSEVTQTLDTEAALFNFLTEEGEKLDANVRHDIDEKRKHIQFRNLFPFDFLNLDFCDRYYGNPPDVMTIHSTVDRLLEWQHQPVVVGNYVSSVSRFALAVTCRVDENIPEPARRRLREMVRENSNEHPEYNKRLRERAVTDLSAWSRQAPLDFFMSAWPKEIARLALQKSWDLSIHDHAFYERQNRRGDTYYMVCLLVEFYRARVCTTYLKAALSSLNESGRTEIPKFDLEKGRGKSLISDLRKIVHIRNIQARAFSRPELPDPKQEILRLRTQGVAI